MSEENIKIEKTGRKTFLMRLLLGFSGLIGVIVSIPVIGALIAPLLRKTPPVWRKIGKLDNFKIGETVLVKFTDASPLPWSGEVDQTASWLRRVSDREFVAFTINCAHLGCPVRWIADAEIFLCPCHGGVYNKDGTVAAGPPPHGLNNYPVRIKGNDVEIQTSPIPITTI